MNQRTEITKQVNDHSKAVKEKIERLNSAVQEINRLRQERRESLNR